MLFSIKLKTENATFLTKIDHFNISKYLNTLPSQLVQCDRYNLKEFSRFFSFVDNIMKSKKFILSWLKQDIKNEIFQDIPPKSNLFGILGKVFTSNE